MTTVNPDKQGALTISGSQTISRVKKSIHKIDYFLLSILFAYTGLGYFLVPNYQYKLSRDLTSYISIAQKYFDGAYYDAINAYWSPLFSWLLALFLGWSESPLIAVRIFCLFIGLLTILSVRVLASRFALSSCISFWMC